MRSSRRDLSLFLVGLAACATAPGPAPDSQRIGHGEAYSERPPRDPAAPAPKAARPPPREREAAIDLGGVRLGEPREPAADDGPALQPVPEPTPAPSEVGGGDG